MRFQCPFCSKLLATSQAYTNHVRIHRQTHTSARKRREERRKTLEPRSETAINLLPSSVLASRFVGASRPRMLLQVSAAEMGGHEDQPWVEFGEKRIPAEEVKHKPKYGSSVYAITIPPPEEAFKYRPIVGIARILVPVRVWLRGVAYPQFFTYLYDVAPGGYPSFAVRDPASPTPPQEEARMAHPFEASSAIEERAPTPLWPLAARYCDLGAPVVSVCFNSGGMEHGISLSLRWAGSECAPHYFSVVLHGFTQPRFKTPPFPRWPDGAYYIGEFHPHDLVPNDNERGGHPSGTKELSVQVLNERREVIHQHRIAFRPAPSLARGQ